MPYRDDLATLEARREELRRDITEADRRIADLAGTAAEKEKLTRELASVEARLERAGARLPLLDDVRVASPCPASWDDMLGDERVRVCGSCQENVVYNLSAMTRGEAESLLARHEASIGVRLYRRADGTVLTNDCPVGVHRKRRKRAVVATAGAMAMVAATMAFFLRGIPAPRTPIPIPIPVVPATLEPCERREPVAASESFNYPASTTIAGQNGGSGWSGPWSHFYTPGGDLMAAAPGYTYPGLATAGNHAAWGSGGATGIAEDLRPLPRQSCGSVYVQFMSQLSDSGYGTPELRLHDSLAGNACRSSNAAGFGGNDTYDNTHVCILGNTPATGCDIVPNQPPNPSSCSGALLSGLNLVVARVDYGSPLTRMWVNPDLSTFDYANPPPPDASWQGLAAAFDAIDIYLRDPPSGLAGGFDEVQVFSAP